MKAESTWGDGPDVLVSLNGTPIILHHVPKDLNRFKHGAITEGSLDMTAEEALLLASELTTAALYAQEMDEIAAAHDEVSEKPGEVRPEIREALEDLKKGILKVKRTKMRAPIENGVVNFDKAEKISVKEVDLSNP